MVAVPVVGEAGEADARGLLQLVEAGRAEVVGQRVDGGLAGVVGLSVVFRGRRGDGGQQVAVVDVLRFGVPDGEVAGLEQQGRGGDGADVEGRQGFQ